MRLPHAISVQISSVFVTIDRVINLFLANVFILYTLKTPKKLLFSGILRGYKMGTFSRNGLNIVTQNHCFCKCLSIILADKA